MVPPVFAGSADRRSFLRLAAGASMVGVGAALAVCSKGSGPTAPTSGSLGAIAHALSPVQVQSAVQSPVNPGKQVFTYILVEGSGTLVTSVPTKVFLGLSKSATPSGSFGGTWQAFTGYAATHDRSPKSPLPGLYYTTIDVSSAGIWLALVAATVNGTRIGGYTELNAVDGPVVAAIGSKAISVKTPVATSPSKIAQICTRTPPCPLHAISLDEALKNGKPTVVTFATPLLCESMLCGPTVDEVILVSRKYGARANVIHVEEFLPGKDLKPPPATSQNLSPAFKAWGFQDEPWVIVIDRRGVIRGRLGPGGSVAQEIEEAVRPLL